MPTEHPPRSASPMISCLRMRCSARSAAACRWRNVLCMRTGSARPRARWGGGSASRERQVCAASESRSQARPRTRRSSGRWSSSRRKPRCSGCLHPQDRVGDGPANASAGQSTRSPTGCPMCNFWANRLVLRGRRPRPCRSHGGMGLLTHKSVEHIYRHHRPLTHHRRQRGNPEAKGRGIPVRLYGAGKH